MPGGTDWGGLLSYGGVITANPTNATAGKHRYALRVPWRAVPRAESNIVASAKSAYTSAGGTSSATVKLTNNGVHTGIADVYAWGLSDPKDLPNAITATNDLRAAGLQVLPAEFLHRRWTDPDDRGADLRDQHLRALVGRLPERVHHPDLRRGSRSGVLRPRHRLRSRDRGRAERPDGLADRRRRRQRRRCLGRRRAGQRVHDPAAGPRERHRSDRRRLDRRLRGHRREPGRLLQPEQRVRRTCSRAGPRCRSSSRPCPPATSSSIEQGDSATLGLEVNEAAQGDNPSLGWMIVTLDDQNGAAQADVVPVGDLP